MTSPRRTAWQLELKAILRRCGATNMEIYAAKAVEEWGYIGYMLEKYRKTWHHLSNICNVPLLLIRSPQYRDKLIKPPYQSLHILHFVHEYPITVHSYHANIPVMISPYDWTWTLGFPHVFRMFSLPRPAVVQQSSSSRPASKSWLEKGVAVRSHPLHCGNLRLDRPAEVAIFQRWFLMVIDGDWWWLMVLDGDWW